MVVLEIQRHLPSLIKTYASKPLNLCLLFSKANKVLNFAILIISDVKNKVLNLQLNLYFDNEFTRVRVSSQISIHNYITDLELFNCFVITSMKYVYEESMVDGSASKKFVKMAFV